MPPVTNLASELMSSSSFFARLLTNSSVSVLWNDTPPKMQTMRAS
eukprot:CAMPEP_0115731720 /NCGR_PEP_ID=MMETSP0272-20121206/84736_1 /TAXON_ID=71861 /ORGANISM="Scrippsiella trochoidea, Strain CCMP3099" /LENGTH=44 /DNA_ID= /DNA_START= /DNA_END= /DNA_ORIENTATION=